MIKLLSIALIGIALTFIVCCGENADNQLHADEIAVYLEIARSSSPSREILISSGAIHAIGMTSPEHVQTLIPSAPEDVSDDFLAKNLKEVIPESKDIPLGDGFVLLGSKDLKERRSRLDRWNSFSRVGFDASRKTAIVWYSNGCGGPLCGEAGLYMLKHNGEKWLIVAESEKIKG